MTINDALFSSKTDLWATPQGLFDKLDAEFHFNVDVCATRDNAKCQFHFDEKINGLKMKWSEFTGSFWMNPPYGREIGKWVKKAYEESTKNCDVVALLPFRPGTKWSDYIFFADEWRIIKGRLHFGNSKNSAPFDSVVVVFRSNPNYNLSTQPRISRIDRSGNPI